MRRAALGSAGIALAACSVPAPGSAPSVEQAATSAGAVDTAPFHFPDLVNIPDQPITFRWLDPGDDRVPFLEKVFAAYEQAHPNVTIQYDGLPWNEVNQLVPLGVRSGTAHDIFVQPGNIELADMVNEGWVAPLDDYVPNFEEWKASFPPGVFVEGISDFNGKSYVFPSTSNRRYGTHLLYNVDYVEEAALDVDPALLTVDEFVALARKITENGNGQYYGFIMGGNQVNRWGDIAGNFARMAGASCGGGGILDGLDFKTGEYIWGDPLFMEGIEVLLRLRDDGSVFPGILSMNAPQARATLAQGGAGLILQGPWNIRIWMRENPDLNFGVGSQPLLYDDIMIPLPMGIGGGDRLAIYADSPEANKIVAGDLLYYYGTDEFARLWAQDVGISSPPQRPEALASVELLPIERIAWDMFMEQMRLAPSPQLRNPAVAQVILEYQPPTPNYSEITQGIYTGQIDDPQATLQALEDAANAELDRAIAAAQAKGVEVERDDFIFPNWDPYQDYTDEDYAELGLE